MTGQFVPDVIPLYIPIVSTDRQFTLHQEKVA
jgi:hypothetical protein